MKTDSLAVAICLLSLNLSLEPAPAEVAAARTEELINIADHAAQVAQEYLAGPDKRETLENWVARRPLDPILESRMKQIWYDHDSVAALIKAIKTPRKQPQVNLYTVNRLLKPFLMAKTEVIRKALPAITAVHKPSIKYSKLPSYTESELKRFQANEKASPKERQKLHERRLEKMKKEILLAFHNEQLARLNKTLYMLMVYADQDETDHELIDMTVAAEKKRQWDYTVILEVIRSEARKMPKERAERLYKEFKPIWLRLRQQGTKTYEDPTAAKLVITGNSTNPNRTDSAGKRLLKVINQIAPKAKMPALQEPKARKPGVKPKPRKPRTKKR
ncbi:MAG: hypothetical protein ISS78_06520 [Phycisphaerae bacterium]|nr:hypothetical protein [Phycisphaerae bacterium]